MVKALTLIFSIACANAVAEPFLSILDADDSRELSNALSSYNTTSEQSPHFHHIMEYQSQWQTHDGALSLECYSFRPELAPARCSIRIEGDLADGNRVRFSKDGDFAIVTIDVFKDYRIFRRLNHFQAQKSTCLRSVDGTIRRYSNFYVECHSEQRSCDVVVFK